MKSIRDICYGPDEAQRLDLHIPDGARATYIFIHGGGLASGDKAGDSALFDYLTARGIAVASLNYRMLPGARFPEFVEDCAQAAALLVRDILPSYGLGGHVVLGGSSAGAFISMLLAFDRHYLEARGLEPEAFDGFLFDAGQPTCHFALLRERGLDMRRQIIDETAPLYHVQDARPGKPLLFITAGDDMPARVEQNALMRRALINYGYPEHMIESRTLEGYQHCGYCADVRPDGSYAYGAICADFILRACGDNSDGKMYN